MSTDVDVEELQTTKSEKLLALVMVAFLLIGGIWTYQKADDWVRDRMPVRNPTAAERAAFAERDRAQQRVFTANARAGRARRELELRRENYRTALDANEPAAALRARYVAANATYEDAVREQRAARTALAAAQPDAAAASRRLEADVDARHDRQELVIFGIRGIFVVVFAALGYWLLARLRARNSRYLPLAAALLAFATIYAFAYAVDYLTDYFDPFDLGVLAIALLGVLATLFAYWVLQRYIARRLPLRRVRRRQCPFCAFPVGDNERCEGCGRLVVAACATCEAPRRVGVPHCGACGAA